MSFKYNCIQAMERSSAILEQIASFFRDMILKDVQKSTLAAKSSPPSTGGASFLK